MTEFVRALVADARPRTACSSIRRSERRRFLDRLVFAAQPAHAAQVAAYERALRERPACCSPRTRRTPAWLDRAGGAHGGGRRQGGARPRAEALAELTPRSPRAPERPFPRADLSLSGAWERRAAEGATAEAIEAELAAPWPPRAAATAPPAARWTARTAAT